ncbi:MAG TPA: prephenate dehydrogenase/arogenate dehydrogenase family protein [Gemmatimonadales bacterium]|nr:prephenate dehydrogenase/arogenate dehydrogenase family protein [Gemmatimonadales bacterium]
MRPEVLGVIGLGVIGGSLARQAKRAGVKRVLGWSPEPAERARAAADGAVDDAPPKARDVARAAQLLVLAAPPAANLTLLDELAPQQPAGALATDTGSVKRPIVARAEALGLRARFAGSHPLAGSHRSGFGASQADLFRNALVYVTPLPGGDDAAREIVHFWEAVLEAQAVVTDAARHDAELAVTSHLPQAVASLLANVLATAVPRGARVGPGARDTTRLAASAPKLWTEILLQNRDHLLTALQSLGGPLEALEAALRAGDGAAVERWLGQAAEWRRGIDA